MATAASHPVYVKDSIVNLTFEGESVVDYSCEVQRAAVIPTPGEVVTYQPLCTDESYVEQKADTFALELRGVQDWSANGLSRLLWEHAGEEVAFSVIPMGGAIAADNPAMTGTAKVTRPAFGGDGDAWAEFDLELPIVGIPTLDVTP